MRLLYAIAVVLFAVLPTRCVTANNDTSKGSLRLVASEQHKQRVEIIETLENQRVKESKKNDLSRPATLKDLLFNKGGPISNDKNPESVALEPWVPGRGAVGVKVEVTW